MIVLLVGCDGAMIPLRLGIFQKDAGGWATKSLDDLKAGERVQLDDDITVIRRFLDKKE